MAGELYPVAGCRFYIGGVISVGNVDLIASDFASQTWVEVDGYANMGAIGDNAAVITQSLINRGRDYKQKGTANAPQRQDNFAVVAGDAGQEALRLAALPSDKNNYAIRIKLNDTPAAKSSPVTVTIASPGVFSWTAHGLAAGTPIKFSTTGALPTGLVAGTTYYVINPTTDAFSVSATAGGAAIATTGTQSGTHTGTTMPAPSERLMAGLVMSAMEAGGEANTMRMINSTIEVNSNTVRVARLG